MKTHLSKILFVAALLTLAIDVSASSPNPHEYRLAIQDKKVSFSKLLEAVSKKSERKFLLHSKARAEVVSTGIDYDELTYDELLNIVDLNGMAAVDINGIINIVPAKYVKQYPIPLVNDESEIEHGSLWVTKVINVGSLKVNPLVPILRSLVRTSGHLATHGETNSMLIVAPYNSVKRIEAIVNELKQKNKS